MSDVLPRLSTALADRYRVERELGAGGMATVYLAHDLKHERDVALKVLHPELAAVLGAERFLTEIKTTAKLQHPHILPLLDSGEAGGLLFYVMPVVDGESLRQRLQRDTQLPVDDAVRITKEVGSALDYAHRHGVIHRDIKPENILLHDNAALVTDFGIALAVTAAGGARLTQTGLSLGTPQYMSPEQAMGEKAVDGRTDVYALGCVLYEMLAGQAPFTGPTAQAIVAQVLTTDALAVTTHRKTVPPNVARAVHAALQKLPADRFATIAEFTAALDGASTAAAMRAQEETGAVGVRPTPTRMWGFVAAALTAGVAIGAAAFSGGRKSAAAGEPRYYQIALPDTALFVAGVNRFDASLPSLAITRDGRTLVYVAATPSGQRLALVRLDRGTVTVLRGTDGAYLPTFSPDGRSIAFASGRTLHRISIEDGTVSTISRVEYPSGLIWAPDGRILLTGHQAEIPSCASAVPEAGGPPVALAPQTECIGRTLAQADSAARRLIITDLSNGNFVLDTQEGTVTKIETEDGSPVRGSGPIALGTDRLLWMRDSSLLAVGFDARSAKLRGAPVSILTNVRREAWTGIAHASLADDGTLVWASGGDASVANFVWLDRDGKFAGTALAVSSVVTSYSLSPDENRIAYTTIDQTGKSRLRVADLRRQVTDDVPFDNVLHPTDWIRDGRALVAIMERTSEPAKSVVVEFNASTSRIDTTQSFDDESRDGSMRCGRSGGRGTASGLTVARGTTTVGVVDAVGGSWCRFSPDGSRVVWIRPAGMFVARTSGNVAESRVQVAPAGADEGKWSEDGKSIYYRAANNWYVVDAPTADMRPAGPPRLVFTGRYLQAWASWERARSGRFLMLQGAPSPHLRTLNVMTNFPALVEQKMRAAAR